MKHLQERNDFILAKQKDGPVERCQMDVDIHLQIHKDDELLTAKELDSVLHSQVEESISQSEKIELKERLTMKGNNLIALHSLKKEFESKLKSIHISLTLITFMIIVLLMSIIFVIYLNLEIR
ncbi:hypothetical protein A6A19_02775 [Actinobacillus delphinicola]|uniref:hypothetical protein n=1 Tax=Actinobacillus delphinicola TaxID=51161 RepID=UPI0024414F10|nr:hypothetical protein [Actinobacillus delphinicola]MDG6896948.1 hypothetical protein [Actinobacillus delphinicola]